MILFGLFCLVDEDTLLFAKHGYGARFMNTLQLLMILSVLFESVVWVLLAVDFMTYHSIGREIINSLPAYTKGAGNLPWVTPGMENLFFAIKVSFATTASLIMLYLAAGWWMKPLGLR